MTTYTTSAAYNTLLVLKDVCQLCSVSEPEIRRAAWVFIVILIRATSQASAAVAAAAAAAAAGAASYCSLS